MADYANPFGAPNGSVATAAPPSGAAGPNPFDPLAAPASATTTMNGTYYATGAPPQTPQLMQYQQPQYQQQSFGGMSGFPSHQPSQQQQHQQDQNYPFGQNYGNMQQQQAIVPVAQQPQSQWVLGANSVTTPSQVATPSSTVASFDPFAAPPAQAPVPPTPQLVQQQMAYPSSDPAAAGTAYSQDPFGASNYAAPGPFSAPPAPAPVPPTPPLVQQQVAYPSSDPTATGTAYSQDPFGASSYAAPSVPASAPEPQYQQQQMLDQAQHETQMTPFSPPRRDNYGTSHGDVAHGNSSNTYEHYEDASRTADHEPTDEQQQQQYLNNYNDRQMVPATTPKESTSTAVTVRSPDEVRNKYSQALARQAGPLSSPLPKAELVRKKGYVLSRISFRTIVMKKWKQSFWVQYGSHTMLWFRNEADFDDWLNNPYHTQSQRNFLIKLAVNFVHDLYKPNVRGYQVTQCRTKPYGNKVVRQFKLERWMDYGPTIAAAFGSYDPREVDACREAIVECMKNTPLDNGIRATGAVKEYHERQQAAMQQQQQQQEEPQQHYPNGDGGTGGGERYQNYQLPPGLRPHSQSVDGYGQRSAPTTPASQSMATATDLLGGDLFDDAASVPAATSASTAAVGDLLGGAALIPATHPSAAYPGFPSPTVPNGSYESPSTAQQYHGAYPGAAPPYPSPPQQQQQQHQQQSYGQNLYYATPSQPQQGGLFPGYPQQMQQTPQPPGTYPTSSYPQPSQF